MSQTAVNLRIDTDSKKFGLRFIRYRNDNIDGFYSF